RASCEQRLDQDVIPKLTDLNAHVSDDGRRLQVLAVAAERLQDQLSGLERRTGEAHDLLTMRFLRAARAIQGLSHSEGLPAASQTPPVRSRRNGRAQVSEHETKPR